MKFKYLLALAALLSVVITLFAIGALSLPAAVCLVVTFQLAMLCLDGPHPALFVAGLLSNRQAEEFSEILDDMKAYDQMFKELHRASQSEDGSLPVRLKKVEEAHDALKDQLRTVRRVALGAASGTNSVRFVGDKAFVTDDCALAFAGVYIACSYRQEKWNSKLLGDTEQAMEKAAGYLGVTRAALTGTDIPLPTIYVPQVVELVYKYGQFRQYATVFPLGSGTVNLPQLKPGEDAFGLISVSAPVPEKRVQAQNVTFTAQKVGGIVRIPTEIEEDTFIPLGQFLARYVSRRFANFEDTIGFLGDNSATYGRYGVGPYTTSIGGTPQLQQLAAGKTKVTDATLNDFRALRTRVNGAVYQTGMAAYYMNPTLEALLVTFNTLGAPLVYQRGGPGQVPTLDGFPIHWVGVMQPYSTAAEASAFLAVFGDLSYWYLGERGAPRVESSREVYFATDEVGMRAVERIDVQAMAPDAMSALQTAAA